MINVINPSKEKKESQLETQIKKTQNELLNCLNHAVDAFLEGFLLWQNKKKEKTEKPPRKIDILIDNFLDGLLLWQHKKKKN